MQPFSKIFLVAIVFFALSAFRPQGKNTRVPKLTTFFACKQDGRISMSAEQFLEFMEQPLCAKDSVQNLYRVSRFEILYAETGLYQDSAGLPIVHTDYQFANFEGDTISSYWKKMFREHTYRGDTIRFTNIRARSLNDSLGFRSSDIELIIQ